MQACRERMHSVVAARAPDHVRPIAGKGVQDFSLHSISVATHHSNRHANTVGNLLDRVWQLQPYRRAAVCPLVQPGMGKGCGAQSA